MHYKGLNLEWRDGIWFIGNESEEEKLRIISEVKKFPNGKKDILMSKRTVIDLLSLLNKGSNIEARITTMPAGAFGYFDDWLVIAWTNDTCYIIQVEINADVSR